VEVDHSRIRVPARYEPFHALVTELGVDVEEALELVVCTDVVAGKDV
jgi:hypothetical protein